MKESELRHLIREMIKEQGPRPSGPPTEEEFTEKNPDGTETELLSFSEFKKFLVNL